MRKNNHSRQYWAAVGIVGLIGVWKVDFVDAAVTFTGAYTTNPTTWNNKNNWNPNTAVAGGSNTVLFDDTADANLNGASISTGANQAALQLDLGDNSGDTLTSSFSLTDNAILIAKNATGSNPTGLLRNASGTQTINAGLTLGKTQTWNVSGNGSLIVNGVVGDGGLNYGLTKSSGGTLELSGVNTFSGPFILQGGTVIVDNAASLGADTVDPVQLDTATSTSNATLLINNGVTLANSLIAQANTNLKVVTIGGASTLTGSASFTGAITLNQGIQIQATAGQTISATGIISDGSTPGTVAKIDGGTLIISGVNTFTGGFTARGGTTIVANNLALGSPTSTALVSGTSSTTTALLLSNSGISLAQNITVQSNVNTAGTGGTAVQYGATIGGAPGQTSSTWTGNIAVNQATNLTAGSTGTVTFSGNITDGVGGTNSTGTTYPFVNSNLVKTDNGTVVLSGSNTYSGSTTVATGSLIFSGAHALPVGANLNLAPGAVVQFASHNGGPANITVEQTHQLTLTGSASAGWGGVVDLTNNDLIVHSGSLSDITSQVKAGYGGGSFSGTSGITSSAAAADSSHLTTIGVLLNNDGNGNAIYGGTTPSNSSNLGSFDGSNPALNDVLIKYTYYGDTNLDGAVDGSDYTNIDNGFNAELTGWQNGDFNYDGVIDGSDYTLIDNAFNTQGASLGSNPAALLATSTAQIAGTSAVPEPAGLALLGAPVALLGRHRKRKRSLQFQAGLPSKTTDSRWSNGPTPKGVTFR